MTDAERDARIAALETAVTQLREDLARAQRPRFQSMRMTSRCPGCGGRKLLQFTRIKEMGDGGTHHDLSLQKVVSAWWGIKLTAGALQAFACRTCKLVEWHAHSLDDVQPNGEDVFEVEGPAEEAPDSSPYR